MKSYIPRSSSSTLRVFNACLLSFLLIATPLATLAASMKSMTAEPVKASEPNSRPAQAKSEPQPTAATGFFNFFMPPPAGILSATLTDNITPNTTKVDKGSTINYTATITNGGSTSNGVEFQDTPDVNTTLVPGSVHASPVANDDVYNWVGNTVLDTSARSLSSITANDTAPTDSFTLNTTPTVAPSHGSVTISANGHFVYTPAAGYVGDDTFQYTISNNTDATLTSTGTVTIHMPVRVWYVQNTASNGDGRSNSPFNSPASASTAANSSTDTIYIFSDIGANASLNGNFSIDNGQGLFGQGVALVANSITLFAAGSAPTTTDSSGNGVTLATGSSNAIGGFNIGNCSGSAIASTTNFGTLTVNSIAINTTGQALNLGTGTLAGGGFTSITSSGGTNNIALNAVNGPIALGSGALSGASGSAFVATGSNNATITYSGTISKTNATAGKLVDIQSHTGNNITLSGNLNCSSGCTGINLGSNSGGTIDFSAGTKTINTGTNQAITLTSNTGATINFSNGGLNVDTTTANGFDASGGGTINITTGASDNTIDSTTGTPFNAANVTFGASGVTFKSISANGGIHGILLDTTTGNFTVTGDGTTHANGSGGALSNMTVVSVGDATADPVYLKQVNGTITLKSMNMSLNASGTATSATGGMYVDSNLGGTATINVTGCIFVGRPTASGANTTQQKALLQFETGNNANVTGNVQDCFFNGGRTYGVFISAAGTSTLNATVNQSGFGTDVNTGAAVNTPGSSMTNATPLYLGTNVSASGKIDFTITANTFWGADGINGGPNGVFFGGAASATSASHNSGTFSNNKLGKTGVTGSGCASNCAGVGMSPGTAGTYNYTITNNDIRQTNSIGINFFNNVGAGATFSSSLHIKGNTLAEPDTTGSPLFQRAIAVVPGNSGGANTNVCAEIGGAGALANTISGAWQTSNFIRISNLNNTGTITLPGLSPTSGASQAAIQSFVEGNNSFPGSANTTATCTAGTGCDVNANNSPGGGPINGGSPCPLLLAFGGVSSSGELFDSISNFDLAQSLTTDQTTVVSIDSFSSARSAVSNGIEAANSAASSDSGVTTSLSQQQLDTVVAAAIQRWTATGLTPQQIASLRAINFEISDLSNAYLGEADGNRILIDRNAEGRGWFVDPNPLSDASFAHAVSPTLLYTDSTSAPAGHVDLLTAIEHEMGHHLKLDDTYSATERDNLMYGYLTVGERRLPAQGQAQSASNSNKLSRPHFLALANASEPAKSAEKSLASKSAINALRNHSTKGRALGNAALLAPVLAPVDVTFGTLTANKIVKVKFSVTVNNSFTPANATSVQTQGVVKVTGNADTLTDDPDSAASGDATVTLISRKDLALTSVSDGVTTINPGQTLTYTITYSNPGHAATGVFITETVPVGTTYNSVATPGWTCTPNNNAGSSCTKSIGSLAAGAGNATTTFAVTVNSPAASHLNTISDTASIDDDHAYEADFDTSNNSASDTNTTLNAQPAFGTFTKDDGVSTTTPGSTLTYTITYANTGNQDAEGVVITDTVPTGTTFNSGASTVGWTETPSGSGIYKLTVGNLAAGAANSTATFVVTVNNPVAAGLANIVNNTSITDDGTNSASAITASTSDSDTLNAVPDLSITKSPDVSNASADTVITYTLNYANGGNQNATGVFVTETVPANTKFVAAGSSAGWSCADNSPASTVCTNTVGPVAGGGAGGSLTYKVKVVNPVPGGTTQITNTATIDDDHANGTDPTPANNTTGNVTTPVCQSSVTVTSTLDDGSAGTLRKAITDACPGATIDFNISGAGPHTITLSTGELTISKSLTIQNTSGKSIIISGGNLSRVFNISTGTVNISNLTVSGGKVTNGNGAGLLNSGGTVTLTGMLFTGNTAINGGGGAIASLGGTLNIYNSTIDSNTATNGGGVYHDTAGTVALVNDTITSNTANGDIGGGPVGGGGDGGGIESLSGATTTAKNTIIALNGAGANADAVGVTDSGNNLIGTDPKVGALANNGGTTQTRALLSGSPALDAGDNTAANSAGLTTDQRGTGFPRIADSADPDTTQTVDIGAYEAHPTVEDITDKSTNEDTQLAFSFNIGDGTGLLISSVTATSNNAALVTNANLVITGSGLSRTLTITPEPNAYTPHDGTATITVTVTATNGQTATDTFVLSVNPVADTPSVTNASTFVNLQTSLGLVISRNGADGAEVGFFKITNIQNGTLFQTDGTTPITSGQFITYAEGNAGLKFTPTTDSMATGSFDVQASTTGDNTGLGGSTVTATITVSRSDTTTAVTSSPNPSFTNQTVTFTATVASSTTYTGTPTGNVDFFDNGSLTPITGCSARPLSSGVATCQTNALSVGNHTITATYNGDAAFNPSNGSLNTNPQVVNPSLSLMVNDTGDNPDINIGDGTCADFSGKCTLRAAIQEANAIPSDDAITFDTAAGHAFDPMSGPHTITLDDTNGALPAIDGNLTITGPGANQLTVQRSSTASSDIRIFAISVGKVVSISGLTMSGGKVSAGGGGILNNGKLTLTNAVVSGNDISSGSFVGGGIFNGGTLVLTNTTVSGNTGGSGGSAGGGGIFNSDTLTMTNSTVSGNNAGTTGPGGGIYTVNGTVTITNSTLSGNSASNNQGGGIYSGGGTVKVKNTIIAGNTASSGGPDVQGAFTSQGHNFIGKSDGSTGFTDNSNGDQVGTIAAPKDPLLGPLADNGGPTQTMALLNGSPALDAGTDVTTLSADIDTVTTSVTVADASAFPAGVGFLIQIDNEQMSVTAKTANTLTVMRAANGTTAASHTNGAAVNPAFDQRGVGFSRKADGPDADSIATVDIGAFEAQVSIENIADQTTNEDTPLAVQFNTSSGVVNANVSATSSNTTLVPNNPANLSVTGASSPFTLNISPASNQFGTSTITVTVNVGGQVASDTFVLTVTPIADTPSVANITTLEDTQSGAILVSKNAADGAEVTYFKVTNITGGALFLNDGVTQINNNDFVPFSSVGAGLKFTPTANLNSPGSTFGFTVQAATGNVDAALGGSTATSTITVTAVNDAPSFTTTGNPPAVNEDSGAASVSGFVTSISPGPADEVAAGQTVSFVIVTNSNTSLFSSQPAIDSTGKLTYTPAADQNGTATITYHAQDSGSGTAPNVNISSPDQTFTITVTAVNDTPSFTKGADQTVFANSGAQTVNGWATAISAGPTNENSQTVDFIVTNNNNSLFSTQPAVSPTGVLTYTPATNQSGTAIVSVQIHDNGGGADTSAIQTFNITVNKSGTTTALVSSVNPSFTGQTVTFTATVTSNTAVTGPPTGTVQFFDGVNPLTCLNGNTSTETLDGTGKATCQTSALTSAGSPHSISAVYSGDGAYTGSTSNTVSQAVKPVLNLTVNDTGDTSDANLNDGLCADAGGKCTLRAAIEQTNFAASDDTIGFSLPANSTITLQTALPNINGNLVVNGPGANTLTVQRSNVNGTPNFSIFVINAGKTVSISGLTISNGRFAAGGGIQNSGTLTINDSVISGNTTSGGDGAGIKNVIDSGGSATITINNSTISGNATSNLGGGGGISNAAFGLGSTATVNINNSTVSGNSGSGGGGIFNASNNDLNNKGGTARVNINNSTVSGNTSGDRGGGIYNLSNGNAGSAIVTIINGTIAGNKASSIGNGGGINNFVFAGTATVKLSNTIVAGNLVNATTTPDDISGTVDSTSSFNLIGTGGSGGLTNGVNNNQVGVADARLAPLANNGGTTQTQALLPGSPALDAGSNTLATNAGLTTDQRGPGFNRIVDSSDADSTATVDIGAFEAQPSIDAIPDKTTNEDTALPTFNFGVADGGVAGFTVTATSSNTTLVPNANINLSGAGSTRSLSITPAANQFGTATISVTVSGTIGATPVSMTSSFTLTVNSVNDAPSFTAGSNQSVNEDAGAQSVQWATNVSAGPANESSQTVAFTVTNNNNSLFSTQPAISPTGVLTYTPAANANGVATVSVTLMDNGGTANGGVDTSPTVQFTITVNAVNDAPVNSVPSTQQSTARNTDLAFNSTNGNLISISDVDAGNNQVKVTLTATNGKLTLSGTTGLNFSVGNGTANTTMTFTGTITNINNALNGLVFSPTPGFDGNASIQMTTDDQGNTGSGGAQTDTDSFTIIVNKGGVIAFSSATYSVSEAGGSITITVNRLGGSAGTTKVDYATSNGTATAGADYTAASGTFTFGNGETTKTFNVPILEDQLNEANETVNLTLSNAQGSGDLGTPATAVLTINDNDPQPSLSINDVSKNEGNSGTTQFTFTVTLSAVSGQNVSVNYATADGTATIADNDYQSQSGVLTFLPGETQKTITVLVNGDTKAEADENFFVNLSGATNATISRAQGTGTIVSDDTPLVQFSASSYTVAESDGHATITVNRLGDTSKAATVDYATSDPSGLTPCSSVTGNASQRCDYAASVGTLRFATGESSKTIFVPIVNDVYVEGPESFTITLSNSANAELGSTKSATVNITDDDNGGAINPITDDAFFIRQLYIDFLGREPEPAGLQGWLDFLHNTNGQCHVPTDCDRVAVALGFVRSPEFQDRGYFAFRFYVAALGRNPSYAEFIPDVARLSGFLNPADLEANKVAFVNEFMNRQEFKLKYDPTIGDPTSYVDSLLQTAGLPNHPSRNAWIAGLSNNTLTRAQVLRQVVESNEVYTKFYNQAIIVMNYFGFLRRDPDAAYQTWIDIFNHSDDYRVITNGFINSTEYPLRVGP